MPDGGCLFWQALALVFDFLDDAVANFVHVTDLVVPPASREVCW